MRIEYILMDNPGHKVEMRQDLKANLLFKILFFARLLIYEPEKCIRDLWRERERDHALLPKRQRKSSILREAYVEFSFTLRHAWNQKSRVGNYEM